LGAHRPSGRTSYGVVNEPVRLDVSADNLEAHASRRLLSREAVA
jgi:hypothetical protein